MTLAQMRNNLGSLINQVDNSGNFSSTIITTAEANRWINQAFEEVYTYYALNDKTIFRQEATLDLEDGVTDYTFGGDATDVLAITWLGIKYSSTDTFFRKAVPRSYPDTLLIGNETFDESAPVYYRITKKVSGTPTNGIRIDPAPDDNITAGLKLMYIEKPAELSSDSDSPARIPADLHKWIVLGASVNCFYKLEQDNRAEKMESRFQGKLLEFVSNTQTTNGDGVRTIKPYRRRRFNINNIDE